MDPGVNVFSFVFIFFCLCYGAPGYRFHRGWRRCWVAAFLARTGVLYLALL